MGMGISVGKAVGVRLRREEREQKLVKEIGWKDNRKWSQGGEDRKKRDRKHKGKREFPD